MTHGLNHTFLPWLNDWLNVVPKLTCTKNKKEKVISTLSSLEERTSSLWLRHLCHKWHHAAQSEGLADISLWGAHGGNEKPGSSRRERHQVIRHFRANQGVLNTFCEKQKALTLAAFFWNTLSPAPFGDPQVSTASGRQVRLEPTAQLPAPPKGGRGLLGRG